MAKALGNHDYEEIFDQKVGQAKKMERCDLKLILLGDSAVGKSKLVERFMLNDYEERTSSTHALTMYRYNHKLQDKMYKIDIWDTAGQESFNELHPTYYFGAHVAMLVFDVNRKVTYSNLQNWYAEMRNQCEHIPVICIANKVDMNMNAVSRKYKFCEKINADLEFVSAASGDNVVSVFERALGMGLDYKLNPHEDDFMNDVLDLLDDTKPKRRVGGFTGGAAAAGKGGNDDFTF